MSVAFIWVRGFDHHVEHAWAAVGKQCFGHVGSRSDISPYLSLLGVVLRCGLGWWELEAHSEGSAYEVPVAFLSESGSLKTLVQRVHALELDALAGFSGLRPFGQ